jgi:hypothetical protein
MQLLLKYMFVKCKIFFRFLFDGNNWCIEARQVKFVMKIEHKHILTFVSNSIITNMAAVRIFEVISYYLFKVEIICM